MRFSAPPERASEYPSYWKQVVLPSPRGLNHYMRYWPRGSTQSQHGRSTSASATRAHESRSQPRATRRRQRRGSRARHFADTSFPSSSPAPSGEDARGNLGDSTSSLQRARHGPCSSHKRRHTEVSSCRGIPRRRCDPSTSPPHHVISSPTTGTHLALGARQPPELQPGALLT